MGVLIRSVVMGLAAGGRAATAVTVPIAAATRGHRGRGVVALRVTGTGARLGELVVDKLPATPSRLGTPQLYGRLLAGGLGAGTLAVVERRRPGAVLVAGVVGTGAAFAGSVLGASWRAAAASRGRGRLGEDRTAALVEDALVTLAATALVRSAAPR